MLTAIVRSKTAHKAVSLTSRPRQQRSPDVSFAPQFRRCPSVAGNKLAGYYEDRCSRAPPARTSFSVCSADGETAAFACLVSGHTKPFFPVPLLVSSSAAPESCSTQYVAGFLPDEFFFRVPRDFGLALSLRRFRLSLAASSVVAKPLLTRPLLN